MKTIKAKLQLVIMVAFLILLTILFTTKAYAQVSATEITPQGITSVVVDVPDKTAAEMYASVKDWIQQSYHNPMEVLKADIPDKMIRLDGFAREVWSYKALVGFTYDVAYTITLQFKDGKYRYTWQTRGFWYNGSKAIYTESYFFKKNGAIRKVYADSKAQYEAYITLTNLSIYHYIMGNTVIQNTDW